MYRNFLSLVEFKHSSMLHEYAAIFSPHKKTNKLMNNFDTFTKNNLFNKKKSSAYYLLYEAMNMHQYPPANKPTKGKINNYKNWKRLKLNLKKKDLIFTRLPAYFLM